MRSWIVSVGQPRHDLTTREGVQGLGEILFDAGFKDKDILRTLSRLKNIQKELQLTHLGSQ